MNIQIPHRAPRTVRLVALLIGALLLAGCGQKGALQLPPAETPVERPAGTAAEG